MAQLARQRTAIPDATHTHITPSPTNTPCAEEDRKERRRKLGLPEELTEEEKAKEAARQEGEKKVAEAKKAAFVASIKPVTCERCCVLCSLHWVGKREVAEAGNADSIISVA